MWTQINQWLDQVLRFQVVFGFMQTLWDDQSCSWHFEHLHREWRAQERSDESQAGAWARKIQDKTSSKDKANLTNVHNECVCVCVYTCFCCLFSSINSDQSPHDRRHHFMSSWLRLLVRCDVMWLGQGFSNCGARRHNRWGHDRDGEMWWGTVVMESF